ncbi:nudC domain-containing protein 3 [Anarrhichthys ocellatus]|uniref:nudC domain-containing protein 3 n=1 Tax=Anarrhichthys ocellatus TaxID=433405 RepID=UPI0012ECF238|nr:nudC domain-containing protein 3 [Anarrhichthys ocellatus]
MASPLQMTEMYDNALLGILQHVGNIQDFLQVYFGFLYRKTDFYRLLSGPNEKMGFPPGVAEKMVSKTFRLFEKLAENDRERQQSELQKREQSRKVPPAVPELEIAAEETIVTEEERCHQDAPPPPTSSGATGSDQPDRDCSDPTADQRDQGDQGAAAGSVTQEKFQADPDSYNGAVRENYSWSQDYTDLEVRVFVPKAVVKGRQVRVALHTGSMQVCVREGDEERTLMEGEFTHKINTENSLWSLEPGSCVVLSLSKTSEVWWNAVLKGEKEIDINQINRERSMASVDEEEHAVLDRLSFDYHQKLQGKPQSHETKVHDMLKKGWDAEGSPFRGQQFDPSMFDIPPSAVQF